MGECSGGSLLRLTPSTKSWHSYIAGQRNPYRKRKADRRLPYARPVHSHTGRTQVRGLTKLAEGIRRSLDPPSAGRLYARIRRPPPAPSVHQTRSLEPPTEPLSLHRRRRITALSWALPRAIPAPSMRTLS